MTTYNFFDNTCKYFLVLVGFCSDQIATEKEKSFNRASERGSQREKVRGLLLPIN